MLHQLGNENNIFGNETLINDPKANRIIAKRAFQSTEFGAFADLNWEEALKRFNANFDYPAYYQKGYHGVSLTEQGYLSQGGAMTWDPVVRETFAYLEVPGFSQGAITQHILEEVNRHIITPPTKILDMGTGTGYTALALADYYPKAQIWGIDLAAPMLVVAEYKAKQAGVAERTQFRQASAHQTNLPDGSFDLITAWILFHELPASFTPLVLAEMYRLCAFGGRVVIYDAFSKDANRFVPFAEPYLREFQQLDFKDELEKVGFKQVSQPKLPGGQWYAFGRKV